MADAPITKLQQNEIHGGHVPPVPDPAPVPPVAAETPSAPSIDQRLDRIERSIDGLRAAIPKEKPKDKSLTKAGLAAALGLLGLKAGGTAGTVIGLSADSIGIHKQQGWAGVKALWHKVMFWWLDVFNRDRPAATSMSLKWFKVLSIAGAAVGTVAGAVIGWQGGGRIENPEDLINHPIESMKKIFGPAPKKTPENSGIDAPAAPASATPTATTIAAAKHEGVVSETLREQRLN